MLNLARIEIAVGAAVLGWSLAAVPAVEQGTGRTAPPKRAEKAPRQEPHRVLGDIPFSYSYPETLARARSNGRPILAYFTFDT
jgi:hypothetical protein